ncbi:MAG: hypothetical protein H7Y11_07040 [Armatimonadetes bacterium]|nr:hypothetical protein [Anaerolineae bacterium]
MTNPVSAWQQSTLNGGGFIEGIFQDPQLPDTLYARSDVAGVFKSLDGGRSWQARNHGMSACHQHDVRSFVLSPHDGQLLFRGSGSVRGGTFFGTIHKSVDGGDYWYPVCREVDFYGNGETRQYGEVIQIDPHDSAFVVAGGYSAGIWISNDKGENWTYTGLKDERISCVYFHPTQKDTLYVGTIGSFDRDPVFVAQQYDYIRPNPARLYRSSDRGATWEVLHEGMDFAEIVFDPKVADTIHAACVHNGVMKSTDGGRTWVSHAPGMSKYLIGTIAIDPHNPMKLYAGAETFPNADPAVPPIGVYHSADGGESWQLIRWHIDADIRNYPTYMTLPYAGWATSKIRVDARDSHTLYMSNWYGVAISHDTGLTWDANHFAGMENICIENMVVHPAQPETLFIVMADHSPKVSTDGGRTFTPMARPNIETTQPDSTAIVASRYRPDLVFYSIKGASGCSIIRAGTTHDAPQVVFQMLAAADTEESRLAFQSRAAGVSVQSLAEDPFQAGKFYAYLDGILAGGAGLYQSLNWGETWERLSPIFPTYITRVPHERYWIENELLSVVIAQTKNVCGTNQLLCVDPHRQATLYVGEWTEGLFRSTDGGSTWQNISHTLPFQRERASVLNVIRADEHKPGVLYAGFIREGLWRSSDYGDTWEKLFPNDDRIFNATSVAVGGTDGKLIVVVSEPLYWSPCASAVYVSHDSGQSWQDIYDKKLGAIRWKSVAIEPGINKIYAASCGNSAFYIALE